MKKRGEAAFIGWVLLILFAVGLGAAVMQWTRGFVKKQGEDLSTRADAAFCDDASINVEGICQTAQFMNFNITNTNNINIESIRFRFIDLYDSSEVKKKRVELVSGDSDKLSVLKQGTIKQAKLTPVLLNKNKEIICEGKSLTFEEIKQC